MKKILTFLIIAVCLLSAIHIVAQPTSKMNYQGVARNASGNILANQSIGLRLTIENGSGGPVLYQERQNPTTNQFGLFTVQLGGGTVLAGVYGTIDWSAGNQWLKVEMDPTGNTSYTPMGESQLLSVAYANVAISSNTPWATSGANIYNTNTGNVGIGTASPTSQLEISGTQPNEKITWTNSANFGRLLFNESGTIFSSIQNVGSTYSTSNRQNALELQNLTGTGPISFWTNGTERMRITSAGNIGVGTTAPAVMMHLLSATSTPLRIEGAPGMYVSLYESGNYRGYFGSFAGAAEDVDIGTGGGNTTGKLHLTIQASPKMTIDAAGYVGIGTTSPDRPVKILSSFNVASQGILHVESTGSGNVQSYGIYSRNAPADAYGIGAHFEGGGTGAESVVYATGAGGYTGFSGFASGGSAGSLKFGVDGESIGPGSLSYGLYGYASGASTNYSVYCNGSGGYTGTWSNLSDIKFKKDIVPVSSALGIVSRLNPVSYQLRADEYPMMNFPTFRQYGFIAQELEKVVPLLVEDGKHPGATKEDKLIEFKSVNYIGMIPILARAIQELNAKVDMLQSENQSLKTEISSLKGK